jgi:3-oxoadipate enol-lactonase
MDLSSDPMPGIVHKGLNISYEVIGSGDPVLFLPGTSIDSSMWLSGALGYLEGFRSIMVDPRDTPKSDEAKESYGPADLAAEALAVLTDSGEESAHIVGYSLGGTVAQELAVSAPDRVRSLTLVCTWAKTDPWLRHVFEWLRDGLREVGPGWADRAMLWLTLGREFHRDPVYENVLLLQSQRGQSTQALDRQLECDAAHDCLDRVGSIKAETLVIAGKDDVWIPARYGRELAAAIPKARLETVDGPHGFPIESAEAFFSLVREQVGRG